MRQLPRRRDAAAGYDLSSYAGVLGSGSDDVPNAIPGDPSSRLVVKSQTGGSMNGFYQNDTQVEIVRRWVVEDSLAER